MKRRRNLAPEDDIDHQLFDCDKYIKNMIKKEGIEGLRFNDNKVRQGKISYYFLIYEVLKWLIFLEIKTLDLTMKELVHKNYTKFIGASDTITKVCFWASRLKKTFDAPK